MTAGAGSHAGRLVVLVGPTAVGKTAAAVALARRLNGEIVSADSRLFYRGMDIGTAKPTAAELALAPHHLIDVAEPADTWSLAVFQARAQAAIAEIQARGRLPFLVGGTGQYIQAVLEGWSVPRQAPDPLLRSALEAWAAEIGPYALHARLAVLDPSAAAIIDARNLRRTVRALEVIFGTGRRFSEQRTRAAAAGGELGGEPGGGGRYHILTVGLRMDRPALFARIDARIEAMLAAGLVEEVRGLLAQGCDPHLPAFSAIGYREVLDYLGGLTSLPEAVMLMKHATHQYVRRQANWFKESDPQIHWFDSGPGAVDAIEAEIRAWQSQANFAE